MSVDTAPVAVRVRSVALDRLRGLAIICMVVDHLCVVLDGPYALRLSVGRVAMPLFFLLAGHLVRRMSWRHYWIALVGAVLPLLVPWVDSPNVLVWYVMGAGFLVLLRQFSVSPWFVVVPAAALAANGFYPLHLGTGYDGAQLLGLMAAGALMPRSAFAAGGFLPAAVGSVGRYPLSVYVGHLLLLQGLLVAGVL